MNVFDRKQHWENIYNTKQLNEVSWYQHTPVTSLAFIDDFKLPLSAKIIDVGAGDSHLVDHLLEIGYHNITVADISAKAIERAKERLGNKAEKVKWIVTDITDFDPPEKYDLWHDRAAFHFLTDEADINKYLHILTSALNPDGWFVVGTFSENGPAKCSGIEIKQYTESAISGLSTESLASGTDVRSTQPSAGSP